MVGPGKSWPPPAEGWPIVPFLHGVRDIAVRTTKRQGCTKISERMDVADETSGETGRLQCNKEPRFKMAATSGIGRNNRQRQSRSTWQKPNLGSRATLNRIFRKTVELEVAKQIVGPYVSVTTLWRGRPLPKRKWRLLVSLRVRDVGALTTLGTFAGVTGGRWGWWIWTNSHLIREPLGMSGLK
jgi:hypothetical protein